MTGRRTHRRCYSILGALHEHGEMFGLEICQVLRCGPGTLYPELTILEADGLIVARWVSMGEDRPRRRYYRIATPDERADHKRRRDARQAEPVSVRLRRRTLWGTTWLPDGTS